MRKSTKAAGALTLLALSAASPGLPARAGSGRTALKRYAAAVHAVVVSPDGRLVASGGDDREVRLWELGADRERSVLADHAGAVSALAFSPDGKLLAVGSRTGAIRVWDCAAGAPVANLTDHGSAVTCLYFGAEGTLLSGSADHTVRLWNRSPSPAGCGDGAFDLAATLYQAHKVVAVMQDAKSKRVLVVTTDGAVRTWDLRLQQQVRATEPTEDVVSTAAFSPDGTNLVVGTEDGNLRFRNLRTGANKLVAAPQVEGINNLSYTPDGKFVLSADDARRVRLWSVKDQRTVGTLSGHRGAVYAVAGVPGGKGVVSGGLDQTVRLWDMSACLAAEKKREAALALQAKRDAEAQQRQAAEIRKEISKIRAEKPGTLPEPEAVPAANAGGRTLYSVLNQTESPLTVLLTGPQSKKLTLHPQSQQHVSLAPGSYQIAASVSKGKVRPFYGSRTFNPGYTYNSRFFIRTSP